MTPLIIPITYRAMFQNPAAYPDPDTFRPERFLSPDGTLVNDPALKAAFGFGRRSVLLRITLQAHITLLNEFALSF